MVLRKIHIGQEIVVIWFTICVILWSKEITSQSVYPMVHSAVQSSHLKECRVMRNHWLPLWKNSVQQLLIRCLKECNIPMDQIFQRMTAIAFLMCFMAWRAVFPVRQKKHSVLIPIRFLWMWNMQLPLVKDHISQDQSDPQLNGKSCRYKILFAVKVRFSIYYMDWMVPNKIPCHWIHQMLDSFHFSISMHYNILIWKLK